MYMNENELDKVEIFKKILDGRLYPNNLENRFLGLSESSRDSTIVNRFIFLGFG